MVKADIALQIQKDQVVKHSSIDDSWEKMVKAGRAHRWSDRAKMFIAFAVFDAAIIVVAVSLMRKKVPQVTRPGSKISARGLEQRAFQDRSVRKSRNADVSGVVEVEFGRYLIKAGILSGNSVARAFPKPPAKTQAMIADAVGETPALAIEALIEILEERDRKRSGQRRLEGNSGTFVPSEREYSEALRQIRLTPMQVTFLKALTVAGKGGLTIGQLSQASGYKSREASIKVFKKIGLLIAEYLELELPEAGSAQNDGAAQVLAFSHVESDDEPATWIMHQELRDAVRSVL